MPSSRVSSQPRDQTQVSHTIDRFFAIWASREALLNSTSTEYLVPAADKFLDLAFVGSVEVTGYTESDEKKNK